jgi:osmoprotectant transport system ATP-binding protein
MLELRGVSKSFGASQALHSTDLVIPSEKTTVLLGSSGCGKSTLLRLLLGLVRADKGTIRFRDETVTSTNALELRRRMGYVIQDGGLFPHLSARRNVLLMAAYLGWPPSKSASRLEDLARLTQLPLDVLDRFPVQLSGGQRQRVSLMRALMLDPDVLLLDEPLGALDPIIRSELQSDLRQIFQSLKKTVVLVTHDLGEAAFFGDTLVLMRAGRIVQRGTLEDLVQSPKEPFVTRFINAQRDPLRGLGGQAP